MAKLQWNRNLLVHDDLQTRVAVGPSAAGGDPTSWYADEKGGTAFPQPI
jgi:hypothetical protein